MSRIVFFVLAFAFVALGVDADETPTVAHPAYWIVTGKSGSAFILSSVHALPPNVMWRNPEIDAAAKDAGTYVFEVANGQAEEDEATRFIRERGRLPEGQTLHSLLSPAAQKDYLAACALAGVQAGALDRARPWLAAILLTVNYMNQRHLTAANTPDDAYYALAIRDQKGLRFLDTTREQLEFLSRYDETMGVAGFSAMLGDFTGQPEREDKLMAAWTSGNTVKMAKLIDDSFQDDPEGAKIFARHNREWTMRLEDLLDTGRSYFVVVGVAHLVGPKGVPAMLRADGYSVKGP